MTATTEPPPQEGKEGDLQLLAKPADVATATTSSHKPDVQAKSFVRNLTENPKLLVIGALILVAVLVAIASPRQPVGAAVPVNDPAEIERRLKVALEAEWRRREEEASNQREQQGWRGLDEERRQRLEAEERILRLETELRRQAEIAERQKREMEENERRRKDAEEVERLRRELQDGDRGRWDPLEAERRMKLAEDFERRRKDAEETERRRKEAEEAERLRVEEMARSTGQVFQRFMEQMTAIKLGNAAEGMVGVFQHTATSTVELERKVASTLIPLKVTLEKVKAKSTDGTTEELGHALSAHLQKIDGTLSTAYASSLTKASENTRAAVTSFDSLLRRLQTMMRDLVAVVEDGDFRYLEMWIEDIFKTIEAADASFEAADIALIDVQSKTSTLLQDVSKAVSDAETLRVRQEAHVEELKRKKASSWLPTDLLGLVPLDEAHSVLKAFQSFDAPLNALVVDVDNRRLQLGNAKALLATLSQHISEMKQALGDLDYANAFAVFDEKSKQLMRDVYGRVGVTSKLSLRRRQFENMLSQASRTLDKFFASLRHRDTDRGKDEL